MSTISIPGIDTTPEWIDFGDGEKTLFQLPVLGSPGVPMGVMSAIGILKEAMDGTQSMREQKVLSAWSFFIQTLSDNYPTATRHIASLDENQFKHVITAWFEKSQELGGFDPKALNSSSSSPTRTTGRR